MSLAIENLSGSTALDQAAGTALRGGYLPCPIREIPVDPVPPYHHNPCYFPLPLPLPICEPIGRCPEDRHRIEPE